MYKSNSIEINELVIENVYMYFGVCMLSRENERKFAFRAIKMDV